MIRWILPLLVFCVTATAVPIRARAAEPATVTAKRHFERGEAYYRQGEFAKALEEYKKAQAFRSHPAFIFNIAQCHRMLGDHVKAVFFYKLYLSEKPDAANKDMVTKLIKELEAKIAAAEAAAKAPGSVTVVTTPEGAEVRVDDFASPAVARTPAVIKLAPGQHAIMVSLPGYEKVVKTVTVTANQVLLLSVPLKTAAGPAEPERPVARPPTPPERPREPPVADRPEPTRPPAGDPAPRPGADRPVPDRAPPERRTPPPPADPPRRDPGIGMTVPPGPPTPLVPARTEPTAPDIDPGTAPVPPPGVTPGDTLRPRPVSRRWWLWTGLVLAAGLGGASAATGVLARNKNDDFKAYGNDDDRSAGKTLALVTDLLWGAAALTVVSVTIGAIVASARRKKAERTSLTVTPSCGPTGCGVWATGRF